MAGRQLPDGDWVYVDTVETLDQRIRTAEDKLTQQRLEITRTELELDGLRMVREGVYRVDKTKRR